MAAQIKIDWDALEPQYRAGLKSLKDIGAGFGVSDAAIIKHAKKFGWTRNLAAKIQAAADRKVSERIVSDKVSVEKKLTEKIITDVWATTQADIRTEQMTRATDNRHAIEVMLDELKAQNVGIEELGKLGEIMADPDVSNRKLHEIYNKIISFGGRVDSAKKLIESWVKATEVERKVYGIVDAAEKPGGRTLDDMSTDELLTILRG